MRSGATVVLTRAPEDNAALAEDLRARGVTVLEMPSFDVAPLDDDTALGAAVRALGREDRLVFTSRAGVDAVLRCVRSDEIHAFVAAIGPATARRCAERGITAWTPTVPSGAALGRELPLGDGIVLLARADRSDRAAVTELLARGAHVREEIAYRVIPGARGDTSPARRAALEGGALVVASPAAAEGVASAIGTLAGARILAFGATTARAVARLGEEARILDELSAAAIVRELEVDDDARR